MHTHTGEIGKFVSHVELEQTFKKGRRQIQRWIAKREFPEPNLYLGQTPSGSSRRCWTS